ncbi:hypothetical protein L596_016532 [Steinernema carpocapsae]|uniref:Uncharacterized protein n=1 Tax=Steinernema carpocapsae TaxID=34508 RepID=A0A4U5NIC4_STECR|nr:hypothetical protein L596_016532 [Steinernema carpocapsae]
MAIASSVFVSENAGAVSCHFSNLRETCRRLCANCDHHLNVLYRKYTLRLIRKILSLKKWSNTVCQQDRGGTVSTESLLRTEREDGKPVKKTESLLRRQKPVEKTESLLRRQKAC